MLADNNDSLSQGEIACSSEARWQDLLDRLPIAAYTCDVMGRITYFNPVAEAVWGQAALLRDSAERYCGSYRLYSSDGTLMPRNECWVARALLEDRAYNARGV